MIMEDLLLLTSTFCHSKFSTVMIESLGEFLPLGDEAVVLKDKQGLIVSSNVCSVNLLSLTNERTQPGDLDSCWAALGRCRFLIDGFESSTWAWDFFFFCVSYRQEFQ